MYASKLAIAVKVGGKVLRERGDTVFLPFGSEYSILVKNLNSVRVQFTLSIDGKDISDGRQFVIPAKGEIEIERFLKNGNLNQGNRFKFIERTESVENHRGGIQVEDGLLCVDFEFERESVPQINHYPVWEPYYVPKPVPVWPKPYYYGDWYGISVGSNSAPPVGSGSAKGIVALNNASFTSKGCDNAVKCSSYTSSDICGQNAQMSYNATSDASASAAVNCAGITAAGSVSSQTFSTTSHISGDGVKHSMVIKLLGEVGQKKVTKPLTVSAKPKCTSCGRVNKSSAKFCAECGTSLEIV